MCVVAFAAVGAFSDAAAQGRRPPAEPAPYDDGRKLCDRGATWTHVMTCLGKRGSVRLLYDTDAHKVVGYTMPSAAKLMELHLYVPHKKQGWRRARHLVTVRDNEELLAITPFMTPAGDALRADIGHLFRTSISVGRSVSVRGVLRRTQAHVCILDATSCRFIVTACESYVRGRLYWSFHGEPTWHRTLGLKLRVDTSRTGGPCALAPSMILDENSAP